jgi:hypothetical protein
MTRASCSRLSREAFTDSNNPRRPLIVHSFYFDTDISSFEAHRERQGMSDICYLIQSFCFTPLARPLVFESLSTKTSPFTAEAIDLLLRTLGRICQCGVNIVADIDGFESLRIGQTVVAATYYCQHVVLHFGGLQFSG